MWPHGHWMWFPMMWIFPLLCLAVMLLLFWRGHGGVRRMHGMHERDDSAREILDRRYARGEISQEEYQRMKTDLEH